MRWVLSPNTADSSDYMGNLTALMYAAGCQFFEGVKFLLKAGAAVRAVTVGGLGASGGRTALHEAISGTDPTQTDSSQPPNERERLKIVDSLLRAGADPYAVYDERETPLSSAAGGGHLPIVRRLIAAGADPRSPPGKSDPPLGTAANGNHEHVARFLLERGVPVDGAVDGVTPLMTAAYRGAEQVIKLLLDYGANANHRAPDGRTPLICAAMYARDALLMDEHQLAQRIVKRLVERGADPNARTDEGRTAFDIASDSECQIVADLLKNLMKQKSKR